MKNSGLIFGGLALIVIVILVLMYEKQKAANTGSLLNAVKKLTGTTTPVNGANSKAPASNTATQITAQKIPTASGNAAPAAAALIAGLTPAAVSGVSGLLSSIFGGSNNDSADSGYDSNGSDLGYEATTTDYSGVDNTLTATDTQGTAFDATSLDDPTDLSANAFSNTSSFDTTGSSFDVGSFD